MPYVYFFRLLEQRVKTDFTLENVESLWHQHFNDETTELPAEKTRFENPSPSAADYADNFLNFKGG